MRGHRDNIKVTTTHLGAQVQDGVLYHFTCLLARKVATCKHTTGYTGVQYHPETLIVLTRLLN